ncbi:BamA/OMP85 family outer membrane protein [Persephonella sp.]
MVRFFFVFVLLFWTTGFSREEKLEIISNYPLPENNIQDVYRKTGDVNQIIDFLKKTDDFEKIIYRDGKLYLERKLRLKKVKIRGNNSFWRREILAITGLVENYPVDLKILHNVYTRLKKFYMDNGFPFTQVFIDSKIDDRGNIEVLIDIEEGHEAEVGKVIIHTSRPVTDEFRKQLIKSSGIEKGMLFRLSEITADIDRIQQFLYEKRYYDSFVNIVSFRPSGDSVDIILYVDLGMEYKITFTGNSFFSSKELEKLLTFKENGFNYYQLVQSTENIERFYRDRGFLDVKVIPSYYEDFDRLVTGIFFTVVEGERYRVGEVTVNTDLQEIKKYIETLSGKYFSPYKIKEKLKSLYEKLYAEGYLNVHYSLNTVKDPQNKTVSIHLEFFRGPKYRLRTISIPQISISLPEELPVDYNPQMLLNLLEKVKKKLKDEGYFDSDAYLDVSFEKNDGIIYADAKIDIHQGPRYRNGVAFIYGTWHLKPSVIEKNLSGDVYYSKEEFDNELDFLYYTNVFDSINPYLEIDRKKKDVNRLYILHEDKRGSFQGLLGYSSEQKLKLSAAVRLKNLFRYGFETSGYIEKTDLGFFYRFTFGNRMLPKRTGVFASYLKSYQYHSVYDINLRGYELSVSRKPNKWIKHTLMASYIKNSLKNQTIYPDNNFNTFKLRFSLIDDHRKPKTNPSGGYYLTGLVEREFYGIKFNKIYGSGRYYLSYKFLIFTQRLTLGYIFKNIEKLPPSERFFLGGISSFRGFGYEKVAGRYGTGGNSLVLLNSEVRYPLFPSINLYGFTFFDTGNVYVGYWDLKKLKTRKTAGTGVYVPTPVGSFMLDVAFKLDKKAGESLYRLEFSINTLF